LIERPIQINLTARGCDFVPGGKGGNRDGSKARAGS
jgi:hypothetical protein